MATYGTKLTLSNESDALGRPKVMCQISEDDATTAVKIKEDQGHRRQYGRRFGHLSE